MWNWYKKHRLDVAVAFLFVSIGGFILNVTSLIVHGFDWVSALAAGLGMLAIFLWASIIVDEL